MFLGGSERSLDFSLGADVPLNPSFTVHGRISPNQTAGQLQKGAVFVFRAEEGMTLGPTSISVPVALGILTDGFYRPGQGGFGYFSVGVATSTALTFIPPGYGQYTIDVGGTYFYTDPTNIGNTKSSIFTMRLGLAVHF
jgi:hypothetical protein